MADPPWPLRQISSARTPSTPATANPGSALVAPRALPEQFQSALQDLIPRCETSQGFCGSRGALTCGAGPICRRWTPLARTFVGDLAPRAGRARPE
jgi:hypothetical protein